MEEKIHLVLEAAGIPDCVCNGSSARTRVNGEAAPARGAARVSAPVQSCNAQSQSAVLLPVTEAPGNRLTVWTSSRRVRLISAPPRCASLRLDGAASPADLLDLSLLTHLTLSCSDRRHMLTPDLAD